IDKGYEDSASIVAAGIINSLVLKRLTKSWRATEFTEYNIDFYSSIQKFLQSDFHSELEFLKLLNNKEEESYWKQRYLKEELQDFMSADIADFKNENINYKRSGKVLNAAHLDVVRFLDACRKKFIDEKRLIEESFDYNLLQSEEGVRYRTISAKAIIFCEGSLVMNNPFFNWLPFSLNKGELLTIESEILKLDELLSKKIFVLPLGKDKYTIGSSISWTELDNSISASQRKELSEQFEKISKAKYTVVDQKAGVRPATRDRRPFIGTHPHYKNFHIFNGMGAKAALMSPLLANELIAYLENGKALAADCDIKRYYQLYQIDAPK